MAATTSTTIAGWMGSAAGMLSRVVTMYSAEHDKVTPFLHSENVAGAGLTAKFSRPTLDAAIALGEGTDIIGATTDEALDIAGTASATAAEVGIVRNFSNLALEGNQMGKDALLAFAQMDGARILGVKQETDAYAQWANASNSVGTSGAAMTLSDFVEAFSTLVDTNHAEGQPLAFLTNTQVKNIRDELTSSGAVVNTDQGSGLMSQRRPDGSSFDWLGVPVFSSTLGTASGGDKIGAFVIDAALQGGRPEYGSTGRAVCWEGRVQLEESASMGSVIFRASTAYGLVEKADEFYIKVVTVA